MAAKVTAKKAIAMSTDLTEYRAHIIRFVAITSAMTDVADYRYPLNCGRPATSVHRLVRTYFPFAFPSLSNLSTIDFAVHCEMGLVEVCWT